MSAISSVVSFDRLSRVDCAVRCSDLGGCQGFNSHCDATQPGPCELVKQQVQSNHQLVSKHSVCYFQLDTMTTSAAIMSVTGLRSADGSDCSITGGNVNLTAEPGTPYQTDTRYGCTTGNAGPHQIHIISLYKPSGSANIMPVEVRNENNNLRPQIIVLTSFNALTWNITISQPINLLKVVILYKRATTTKYTLFSSVMDVRGIAVTANRKYYGYGENDDFLSDTLAYLPNIHNDVTFVSTLSAVYETSSWTLKI